MKVGCFDEYFYGLKEIKTNDDIDNFIEDNRLNYYSLEDLCTKRLVDLTKGTLYSYDKGAKEFSSCYYLDCCHNENNDGSCSLRRTELAKNKTIAMIKNTDFSYILDYIKK